MQATATAEPRATRILPWSRLGDELLAARAAGGNDAAFSALYERYYGPLLGYTRSMLLNVEDARDATQNALESALRALPTREPGRPLRPWLYRIAHNEAITIMRRRRPQTELTAAFEPTVPGPEVDAEQRGRLAQLVDDLHALSERQRGALVMRELNGLSYDEIGGALGLSNEAARRAVFDARNALHDTADGRATECVSVRSCISDGDRRRLRARSIRAHLRACDDCASFQRAICARRADLHVLAPWISGAAVMGALGAGAGGVGGGGALLATGGGASAAAGGGISWAGLPMAAKGLAVAAAVATTGTAAVVEIKQVAEPDRRAPAAHTAQPRTAPAGGASRSEAPSARFTTGHRVRATGATRRSSLSSTVSAGSRRDTPALPAPTTTAVEREPAAAKPDMTPPVTAPVVRTPEEQAIAKLAPLRDAVRRAFDEALAIAADGSRAGLASANRMLIRTLGPLRTAINRVLAPLGSTLPTFTAEAASAPSSALAPVQRLLSNMQELVRRLLGQR
ncbi:MAG: RNA polymerase sigma factor [Solirubrobacteraceae bacterium]